MNFDRFYHLNFTHSGLQEHEGEVLTTMGHICIDHVLTNTVSHIIANLQRSLSDGEHTKIGAIIIYLDILFTRDHFPAWLGTRVREWRGEESGVEGDHRGLETAGKGEKETERDGKRWGEGEVEDKEEIV